MVAAFVDLDVGGVARRGQDARRKIVIKISGRFARRICCRGNVAFARGQNSFDFACADHRVDFRNLLANFVAVALDHAAGHDQLLRAAEFLVLGHLQDRIHRFLLRGRDEAAGVDHKHVGFARPWRDFIARARKNTHHHLAVDEVLRASQAYESDLRHLSDVLRINRKPLILACRANRPESP